MQYRQHIFPALLPVDFTRSVQDYLTGAVAIIRNRASEETL